jgi:hypothetical protein
MSEPNDHTQTAIAPRQDGRFAMGSHRELRVLLEKPPEGRGPFGMATVVYALRLCVAADSLGWPSAARVTAAFDRYPGLA